MAQNSYLRVAILSPGNRETERNTTAENSRFSDLFRAFAARRVHVEPAIYHDDFCEDVREQLMQVDGVLVWVNPIEVDGIDPSSILCFAMSQPLACLSARTRRHSEAGYKVSSVSHALHWVGLRHTSLLHYGSNGSRAALATSSWQSAGAQAKSRQRWKRRVESPAADRLLCKWHRRQSRCIAAA